MSLWNSRILDDCWRDTITTRCLSALMHHYRDVLGLEVPLARDVFAKTNKELLAIHHVGRKGLECIRAAQQRMAIEAFDDAALDVASDFDPLGETPYSRALKQLPAMPPAISGDALRKYTYDFHAAVEAFPASETQSLLTMMCSAADKLAREFEFSAIWIGPIHDGVREILRLTRDATSRSLEPRLMRETFDCGCARDFSWHRCEAHNSGLRVNQEPPRRDSSLSYAAVTEGRDPGGEA